MQTLGGMGCAKEIISSTYGATTRDSTKDCEAPCGHKELR